LGPAAAASLDWRFEARARTWTKQRRTYSKLFGGVRKTWIACKKRDMTAEGPVGNVLSFLRHSPD
jgi:hypothetical protein